MAVARFRCPRYARRQIMTVFYSRRVAHAARDRVADRWSGKRQSSEKGKTKNTTGENVTTSPDGGGLISISRLRRVNVDFGTLPRLPRTFYRKFRELFRDSRPISSNSCHVSSSRQSHASPYYTSTYRNVNCPFCLSTAKAVTRSAITRRKPF